MKFRGYMNSKFYVNDVSFLFFAFLFACATQERVATYLPPLPEGVLNARWGTPVERVKQAIEADRQITRL